MTGAEGKVRVICLGEVMPQGQIGSIGGLVMVKMHLNTPKYLVNVLYNHLGSEPFIPKGMLQI